MNHQRRAGLLITVGIILAATVAQGQIALRFALDRSTYLQYETIRARVEMRNYSGRTIVFGDSEELRGEMEFIIDSPNGDLVPLRQNAGNPIAGTIIKPGATEEVVVPISRLYLINRLGRHTAKVVLRHPMLPQEYESNTLNFTVVNGMKVWERLIGVPDIMLERGEKQISTRRAQVMTFHDGINKVYSLVVDDDKHIYGVVRLGHDIGNFPPICEVDGFSRIHVLIQVSPQVFSYYLFDFNADMDGKDVYVRTDVAPQLVRDPQEGTVMIVGGRRAVKDVDYVEKDGMPVPPPTSHPDPVFPQDMPAPPPASTSDPQAPQDTPATPPTTP